MKIPSPHDRYRDELNRLPASGGGGCHVGLLRVANYGRIAGVSPDQLARDLSSHIHGTRPVPAKEIEDAIKKAYSTSTVTTATGIPSYRPTTPKPAINGEKLLLGICERGADFTDVELWEASPLRIEWNPKRDAVELLSRLYHPDDRLFIGTRYQAGKPHVLPVSKWMERFERGDSIMEHIIPNPLTGEQGLTKHGEPSYRADSCVAQFRFAVIEFDGMPREQQIQFWAGVKLPVVVLLDSGGKSVHGWIRIDAADAREWEARVEGRLFDILKALGADPSCKNEARLSRMVGHYRKEKERWQRILYLNPKGGPVIP